ncbi:MAG: universal stress protein [Bacteroidetes bacterium]|nr:universal stress protein [Bacteroidota bacterium]
MKKILFPTDFSPAAANAYKYAQKIATALNGVIDVLHVFHIPINDSGSMPPEYIQQLLEDRRQESLKALKEFKNQYSEEEMAGDELVHYGLFVSSEIADIAKEGKYDLIIMGTQGSHSALEKFMGSVTTEVLIKAPCPVLAIPEDASFQSIKTIAYATEFRPTDEYAIDQLMKFSVKLGAKMQVVHVNIKSNEGSMENFAVVDDSSHWFAEYTVVNKYSVREGVEKYIKERNVDILALFIPNRRLLERLFHSSFSKKMLFHTSIPLLVFHE